MSEDDTSPKKRGLPKPEDSNVIRIPTLAERDRMRREKIKLQQQDNRQIKEPFFNLPRMTKYLVGSILLVYLLQTLIVPGVFGENGRGIFVYYLAYIPGRFIGFFTGEYPLSISVLISPISYMWLHGGLVHLILNIVTLLAFGAGLERRYGPRTLLKIFFISGLFGLVVHSVVFTSDLHPVIGASGGISGLFAAVLVMLNRDGMLGGQKGYPRKQIFVGQAFWQNRLFPIAIVWIVISILPAFFYLFSPGGSNVAWTAHLGGFLAGLWYGLRFLR